MSVIYFMVGLMAGLWAWWGFRPLIGEWAAPLAGLVWVAAWFVWQDQIRPRLRDGE